MDSCSLIRKYELIQFWIIFYQNLFTVLRLESFFGNNDLLLLKVSSTTYLPIFPFITMAHPIVQSMFWSVD